MPVEGLPGPSKQRLHLHCAAAVDPDSSAGGRQGILLERPR